jgi:predicted NAD-dependent protein-ADP-ribosyltransferase YbiA (DUF1768 family)
MRKRTASVFLALLPAALLCGCAATARIPSPAGTDRSAYPAAWWAPVPADKAASWEVLPQEAGPGEVILSKRNELGLLSNFAATPFTLDGERYASLEGFWQMMMYPEGPDDPRARFPGLEWKYTRAQVAAMTAFEAKAAGDLAWANMKKMGINWVTYRGRRMDYYVPDKGEHYALIVRATKAKIEQNPEVRKVLLATGDLKLRPDHHQPADAPPSWRYFDIYMELRGTMRP